MIQIDRPGEQLDVETLSSLLADTGVQLDMKYGPYLLNPQAGRYVARGTATPEAKRRLSELPGITVFSDPSIQSEQQ